MNHTVSCTEEGRALRPVGITRGIITAAILVILLAGHLVGQSCFISFQSVSGLVMGDEISQNTNWVLAESPYVVAEDVVVTGGVVLTIDAGVVVKFDGNFSLTVYGSIHAVGTSSDPVVFTSSKPLPAPGDWNTVELAGAQNESFQFKNVIVEYARSGVTVRSLGSAAIENSRIADCLVHGIYVEGDANLMVRDNVIERNADGIASNGQKVSGISVVGNSFSGNGSCFAAPVSCQPAEVWSASPISSR